MNKPMTPLSPEGMERADRILQMAQATAAQRRQRRRIARSLSATAFMLIVAAGTFYFLAKRETPPGKTILPPVAHSTGTTLPNVASTPEIIWIKTDQTLAGSLSIRETGSMCKRLNDDELLDAMENAGGHIALVYDGAKTSVVYWERRSR